MGPYRRVPSADEPGGGSGSGGPSSAAAAEGWTGQGPASGGAESGAAAAAGTGGSSGSSAGRTTAERVMDKVYALAWVGAAIAVAKFTDLPRIVLSDERVNRPLLNGAIVLMGINTILTLYLAVYLPRIKGLKDSSAWDVYCPRVIPTMTVLGVVCAILLIRSLWPVFGFLAPLILGVEFIGALFSLHFVPFPKC